MNFKQNLQQSVIENSSFSMPWLSGTDAVETIISKTFFWMWIVLLTVFGVWYYTYSLVMDSSLTVQSLNTLSLVSIIVGFLLVLIMSTSWQRISYWVLAVLLLVFWVFEWFGLAGIFLIYQMTSIISIFLTTAIMFLLLAVIWNALKIDVAKWGTILLAWLLAIIIWMFINMFWQNTEFNFVLNIVWLVIFSAFVIYDLNTLKLMAQSGDRRVELLMALSLFLTFINIFFTLLRLFGSRK